MHFAPATIKAETIAFSGRLQQIPAITIEIFEHRDRAVSLMPGRFQKVYALHHEGRMVAREIVRPQEEGNPPTGLRTDGGFLPFVSGLRQQQGGAIASRRSNDKPTPAVT